MPAEEFAILFIVTEAEMRYFFSSETLVSSWRHNSELMVPGSSRPMQLLRDEVDQL